MMRRSGHTVNDGLTPVEIGPLGVVAGVDVDASVANVTAWGGQTWLYQRAVAAGLDAARAPVSRELALAIGSIAGWRSGVLDLRDDARQRLAELYADRQTLVAGAVLGLPPGAVRSFLDLQEQTPLGWPLLARGDAVVRVGGFRGLGGPWLAPPRAAVGGPDGELLVRCADDGWWRVEADVFGSRVTAYEDAVDGEPAGGVGLDAGSYLITLSAEPR